MTFQELKGNVVLASDNSATTTLGNANGTNTLHGNTTIANLSSPLIPNYTYPVPSGHVGEIVVGTVTTLNYTSINVPAQMASISLSKGVWILTSNLMSNPYAYDYDRYGIHSIGPNSATFTNNLATTNVAVNPGGTFQSAVSAPVSINAPTYYYVNYQSNTPGPIVSVVFKAVRIA